MPDDDTLLARLKKRIENNPFAATGLLVIAAIVGLGAIADAFKNIHDLFPQKPTTPVERTKRDIKDIGEKVISPISPNPPGWKYIVNKIPSASSTSSPPAEDQGSKHKIHQKGSRPDRKTRQFEAVDVESTRLDFAFEKRITISADDLLSPPFSIEVWCDTDIARIEADNGKTENVLGNPRLGFIHFDGPPVMPNHQLVISVWSKTHMNVLKVGPLKVRHTSE